MRRRTTSYLFKNVSQLRKTYQIQVLAFRASTAGMKLILLVQELHLPRVPEGADGHREGGA